MMLNILHLITHKFAACVSKMCALFQYILHRLQWVRMDVHIESVDGYTISITGTAVLLPRKHLS